jgi:hypothetical protein
VEWKGEINSGREIRKKGILRNVKLKEEQDGKEEKEMEEIKKIQVIKEKEDEGKKMSN